MTIILKRKLFWLTVLTVTLLALSSVSQILFPFVVGIMLAYFLDPAADKLESMGLSRNNSALLILAVFLVVFGLIILAVSPLVYEQLRNLVENLPGYINKLQQEYGAKTSELLHRLDPEIENKIHETVAESSSKLFEMSKNILGGVLMGGAAFFNAISLVFITPIVSFYFLRDWDIMIERIDSMLPRKNINTIRELASKINTIISGYIRGQILVCLMLGVFYAIGLSLAGLKYGFVIGLLTGIFSFIPYVGMMVGTAIGLIVAYIQWNFDYQTFIVMGVFITGQFIEGNFITPKIVGDKVNLHPVWIIFALLAGGALFGLTGVILAIPAAAIIGVLIRHFIEVYKNSRYFN
jgi:predicted PurR-regulated permease PerM